MWGVWGWGRLTPFPVLISLTSQDTDLENGMPAEVTQTLYAFLWR